VVVGDDDRAAALHHVHESGVVVLGAQDHQAGLALQAQVAARQFLLDYVAHHRGVFGLVDPLIAHRRVHGFQAGHGRIGGLAGVVEIAHGLAGGVHQLDAPVQVRVGDLFAHPLLHGALEGLQLRAQEGDGAGALHLMGHGQVISELRGHVLFPGREGLADVQAALGDHHAVQIVVAPQQPLGQTVAAEGAVHAENVGLGDVLGLVRAQDAHRQNVGGQEDFLGHIGAEEAHHFSAGFVLPLIGVIVAGLVPLLEHFDHGQTS